MTSVPGGSVREAEGRRCVTAQTVRPDNGLHQFPETYYAKIESGYAPYVELAGAIAQKLQSPLGMAVCGYANPARAWL